MIFAGYENRLALHVAAGIKKRSLESRPGDVLANGNFDVATATGSPLNCGGAGGTSFEQSRAIKA
jgi:hypothetical protein